MEVDSWPSRVHAAKHFSAFQAARYNSGSNLLIDSSDTFKSKHVQESEKISLANGSPGNVGQDYEDEHSEEFEDEHKAEYEEECDDDDEEEEEEDHYEEEEECEDSDEDGDEEDNHLVTDDSDGDEDTRAYFPCPFCYIDIEVHVLCSHLQDEHCFDLKNAVCPLCAANLGKDVMGHFMVQHSGSLKRRRKPPKSALWSGNSAMISKELSSFLGSSTNGRANTNEPAPEPLLSPFLSSGLHSHPEGSQQDESSNKSFHSKSTELSSVDGGDVVDSEERRQRAAFVQQLIASTIF